MNLQLTALELRLLSALIEKSTTTPEYYPLTLNALVAACNQKSNRDPVMQLDEKDVVRALDSLREKKLAWMVTTTGSRTPKYQHGLLDTYPLTPGELAVLCELMLRGPQTASELRLRASRMAPLASVAEVQVILQGLADRPDGAMVCKLGRQPGQREERYAHCLSGDIPQSSTAAEPLPESARVAVMAENERFAALEARVAALQEELEQLKARVNELGKLLQ